MRIDKFSFGSIRIDGVTYEGRGSDGRTDWSIEASHQYGGTNQLSASGIPAVVEELNSALQQLVHIHPESVLAL